MADPAIATLHCYARPTSEPARFFRRIALQVGFLRMSRMLLDAVRMVPLPLCRHSGNAHESPDVMAAPRPRLSPVFGVNKHHV